MRKLQISDKGLGLILDARFGDVLRRKDLQMKAKNIEFEQRMLTLSAYTLAVLAGLSPSNKDYAEGARAFFEEHHELIEGVIGRALYPSSSR